VVLDMRVGRMCVSRSTGAPSWSVWWPR
jgi:hypothetical protein